MPTPIAIIPRGSKIERLSIQSHRIEARDVKLPEKAEWRDPFRVEILAFPYARHDDQVDSLSQLLAWLDSPYNRITMVPAGPIYFVDGKEWHYRGTSD